MSVLLSFKEGYQFGKMLFYTYRSSNFIVGNEYEEEIINERGFTEKVKFWTPSSPMTNSYGMEMWQGDATNILFNYANFNAHFMKIDIRLVADAATGIQELTSTSTSTSKETYDLMGRKVSTPQKKGIYIIGGKKVVIR